MCAIRGHEPWLKSKLWPGLLTGADLLPEPYLQFAILETTDPATLARVMVPIDLQAVLDRRTELDAQR